jgi:hypothetical protein
MGKCSKCGAEAELYESGNPLCVKCSTEIDGKRKQTAIMAQQEPQSERAQAAHN